MKGLKKQLGNIEELALISMLIGLIGGIILMVALREDSVCKHGLLYNVDAQQIETQVIGANGLPVACPVEK